MHVVLSTIPPEAAESLASELVQQRLAACVNIVAGVTSVYRWKGEIQRDAESLLIIKTSNERLPELMSRLPDMHPYDVPEIVALDPTSVHAPYAQWLDVETRSAKTG